MEEEIDLRELLGILLKRWWLILIIFFLAVGISFYYTNYMATPVYEASTKMLVAREEMVGEEGEKGELRPQEEFVGTYEEIVTSTPVLEEITSFREHSRHSVSDLQDMVSVSQVGDTEIISINVTHESPSYAADLSHSIADVFEGHVVDLMNIDNINIIDPALVPESPISPRPMLNLALAGVLGLMLGVFSTFFLEFLDNTVKTTEHIERELDLPVLGSIPQYKPPKKLLEKEVKPEEDVRASTRKISKKGAPKT